MGNVGSVSLEAISTPPTAVVCTGKEAVEVQSTHTHTPSANSPDRTYSQCSDFSSSKQSFPQWLFPVININNWKQKKKKKKDDTELFPTNNPKADWTVLRCYCRLFVVRLPKNKNLIRVKFKLFIFGKTPVTDFENDHILKLRRDWEL